MRIDCGFGWGPPGDDASRAGSTTHEREGGHYLGLPQKPTAVQ